MASSVEYKLRDGRRLDLLKTIDGRFRVTMLAKDFQVVFQREVGAADFDLYNVAGVIASNTSMDFDEAYQALRDGLIKLGAGD